MAPAPTVGAPAPRWWSERLRSASMPGSRPRGCGLVGLLVPLAFFASRPAPVALAGVGVVACTRDSATARASTPLLFRSDGIRQGENLSRVQRSETSLAAAIDGDAYSITIDIRLPPLPSRD